MQQFASLRQKASAGDRENVALLQQLERSSNARSHSEGDWDMSLSDVYSRYGAPGSRPASAAVENQDTLTYYKALGASKRGEDALVEHVFQKSRKQLKTQEASIQQHNQSNYVLEGVRLSDRNRAFHDRLQNSR